jgi:hypothetical protein
MRHFKDEKLSNHFNKYGYVVIKDFVDLKDCEIIENYFTDTEGEAGINLNFYTTIWSENRNHRVNVNKFLINILYPKAKLYLKSYSPVFSNFMVKKSGENSSLGFHQDWTFSDDFQYPILNLWVSLTDLTNENGPLKIIPKSHKLKTPIRARNFKSDLEEIPDFVLNCMSKKFLLKKGDAIFFHENLIHASGNNLSNKTRLAASLVLCHKSSNLVHYFYFENSLGKKYVDTNFFIENSLQEDFKNDNSFILQENINTKHLLMDLLINRFK